MPRARREKLTHVDKIIKGTGFLAALLSSMFTYSFLALLIGNDTYLNNFTCISAAIIITTVEILAFIKYFRDTKSWGSLALGSFFALVSILGSMGSFQGGAKENQLKSVDFNMSSDRLAQIDQQIEMHRKNIEIYRNKKPPWAGNMRQSQNEINKLNQERKAAEMTVSSKTDSVSHGHEVYRAISGMLKTDINMTMAVINALISIILEFGMIYLCSLENFDGISPKGSEKPRKVAKSPKSTGYNSEIRRKIYEYCEMAMENGEINPFAAASRELADKNIMVPRQTVRNVYNSEKRKKAG